MSREAKPPILALVIPCYNEEDVLDATADILQKKMNQWKQEQLIDEKSFCCYVDDGSHDITWEKIKNLTHNGNQGVKLAYNAGQQNALLAGIKHVVDQADCCITLDSDLQDDIEVIPEMIKHYLNNREVVFGIRNDRKTDSFLKRFFANLFYMFAKLLLVDGISNHAEFRLMSKSAMKVIVQFEERHIYLRGLIVSLNFPSAKVFYKRKPRLRGKTKYSIVKLITLALNGITSHSIVPLRFITFLGFIICIASALYALWVITGYKSGYTEPGWASTIVSLYFLGGLIMFSLGITGEYIGKIFLESKKRPMYYVEKTTLSNNKEETEESNTD